MKTRWLVLLLVIVAATAAVAQSVISARAGYVNYTHGSVTLPNGRDGKTQRQLDSGQTLATGHGRAEVLLTPGSFLRLDHESELRMISSRLSDVRIELLSGTASVEVNEIPKGTALAMVWREHAIPIAKPGLYRFEANPSSLRIYVEKGKLELAGMRGAVKSGKYIDLPAAGDVSLAMKYNAKDLDEFDRWNRGRGEQLAVASYSAASAFLRTPYAFRSSLWYLDPFLGFYTYLPYSYSVRSPFGFTYYCPRPVHYNTNPRNGDTAGWGGGGNARTGANSSGSAGAPAVYTSPGHAGSAAPEGPRSSGRTVKVPN